MTVIQVTKNQLNRLVKVTGFSERFIRQGVFSDTELLLLLVACKFIKVTTIYEKCGQRERNKVC